MPRGKIPKFADILNLMVRREWAVGFTEKPSAPVGPMSILDIAETNVSIGWKPPEKDGGTPIKHYVIERRDSTKQVWLSVATVTRNTLECVVSKLRTGNNYFFRVAAENDEGEACLNRK